MWKGRLQPLMYGLDWHVSAAINGKTQRLRTVTKLIADISGKVTWQLIRIIMYEYQNKEMNEMND